MKHPAADDNRITMAQEIELKLTLPESERRRFMRSPLLRTALIRDTGRLVNIYYDTPDLALNCSGIALRLRRNRRVWLQTVKCAGISSTGLSSRPEWEAPYAGYFDFATIDDDATRRRLEHLKHRLAPVFETRFMRTAWRVREGGTELMITLDRGTINAGGHTDDISEVEIELVAGNVDHIFSAADRLMHEFTLIPGPWSKAERGYRLFTGAPETPVRAAPLSLDNAMSSVAAFRHIALACLDHLQLNRDGALHSDDIEYIHQMRVAVRRLTAAIRLFKPVLPERLDEQLLPQLRKLMTVLGKARDLDVLVAQIIAPVAVTVPTERRIDALTKLVSAQRQLARQAVVEILQTPDYGRLLLSAIMQLHQLPDDSDNREALLVDFANIRLRKLRLKLDLLLKEVRLDDPTSLHRLRIGTKKLRYALEFFSPLLPARRTTELLKQLMRLQDTLGQLNDLASAGTLLMECANEDFSLREAVSLVGGWHARRHANLLAKTRRTLKRLHLAALPKAR